jgi:hypothetical protein
LCPRRRVGTCARDSDQGRIRPRAAQPQLRLLAEPDEKGVHPAVLGTVNFCVHPHREFAQVSTVCHVSDSSSLPLGRSPRLRHLQDPSEQMRTRSRTLRHKRLPEYPPPPRRTGVCWGGTDHESRLALDGDPGPQVPAAGGSFNERQRSFASLAAQGSFRRGSFKGPLEDVSPTNALRPSGSFKGSPDSQKDQSPPSDLGPQDPAVKKVLLLRAIPQF